MSQVKIAMLAVAAMLVLSAISVTSASAGWFVNGTELKTSAAISTAAALDEIPTISVPNIDLEALCSGAALVGAKPEIIAGSTLKAESVKFLGCNVTKPSSGCSFSEANATIATLPMVATLSLGSGESDRIVFAPQTKSTITDVEMNESNECAFNGTEPITGSYVENVPNGQLEGVSETLVGLGSVENNSLQSDGEKTYVEGGRALVKLASGSKWSFR
jgi:hypothetical protein